MQGLWGKEEGRQAGGISDCSTVLRVSARPVGHAEQSLLMRRIKWKRLFSSSAVDEDQPGESVASAQALWQAENVGDVKTQLLVAVSHPQRGLL